MYSKKINELNKVYKNLILPPGFNYSNTKEYNAKNDILKLHHNIVKNNNDVINDTIILKFFTFIENKNKKHTRKKTNHNHVHKNKYTKNK